AIALQLTRRPDALLIDEPTRGLDADAREHVRAALQQTADAGTAVLIATHDADFAAALGARVIAMRDGVAPAPHAPTAPEPTDQPPIPLASASASASAPAAAAIRRDLSHLSGDFASVHGVSTAGVRQNARPPAARPAAAW